MSSPSRPVRRRRTAEPEPRFTRDPVDPLAARPARDPMAPAPSPGRDWRTTVMAASGLNLLAGIWLIIAPFVLGYGDGDPTWNDVVFGAIVAILSLARLSGAYRQSWLSYVNALIGVWLFISAFWLDNTSTAAWNDIILGVVVFVLGVISASASDVRRAHAR